MKGPVSGQEELVAGTGVECVFSPPPVLGLPGDATSFS